MPPPGFDAELAPYLDVRREGRPLAALIEELSTDERDALRRMSLVMVRPDAVLAGHASAILDALEDEHGLTCLRLRTTLVDPRSFDAQYVTELPIIAPGLWLHHRLTTEGPCAFAIVAGEPADDESLATRLDRWKGASSPGAEPDLTTLRPRFGRASSFHVVLHTSEDAGDFLQGAVAVFGSGVVRSLLHAVSRGDTVPLDRRWRTGALAPPAAPGQGTVYDVVLGVKRRIVAALALTSIDPRPPATMVGALADLYDAAPDPLSPDGTFADARQAFIELARAERPLLAELMAELDAALARRDPSPNTGVARRWRHLDEAMAPLRLAYGSWFLSGHEEYDFDSGDALVGALAAGGVVVSRWERTLLDAALACDTNPGAIFAGQRTYPI